MVGGQSTVGAEDTVGGGFVRYRGVVGRVSGGSYGGRVGGLT